MRELSGRNPFGLDVLLDETSISILIPAPVKIRVDAIATTRFLRKLLRVDFKVVGSPLSDWIYTPDVATDDWMHFDSPPGIELSSVWFYIYGFSHVDGFWRPDRVRTRSTSGGEILHLGFEDAGDADYTDMTVKMWPR